MRKEWMVGTRKVAIIGTGFVGATIAYALALRDIAREIALIDINNRRSYGEAMDIRHGVQGMGTADLYAGGYENCADCDLIVITAGRGRKPGETRMDLAAENASIMHDVISEIKEHFTRGVILVISNPVDVLTFKADAWMGLQDGKVFSTGCMLDTSRLLRCIADYLGLSTGVINGYVVGEHGDHQVPVWSHVTVGGIPIEDYCRSVNLQWDSEIRAMISEKTKKMGAEIIAAKGKTHYGIATCVCQIADAVLNHRPMIASVCSPLRGEHGVRDVALSVPSVIGPSGLQQRIREKWEPGEYRGFFDAAESVRDTIRALDV